MQEMNPNQNTEDDTLLEAFQVKKEQFRVEIRRKNLASEFQQRRWKISKIVCSQQQNKKIYFSGDETKYVDELQVVYQDLMDYIYLLDFDGIYDVLVAIFMFVTEDQERIRIIAHKIVESGLLEIFGDLLSEQYDQMQNIVNIVLEILCSITIGTPMQNIKIYEMVLKKNIMKFLGFNLNPNIIDSVRFLRIQYTIYLKHSHIHL